MRADEKLRDIPVIVISGAEMTSEQSEQLLHFGQQLLAKGTFTEKELVTSLQRALDRVRVQPK
jgi:CheY-like chemotaxis protein